MKQSYRALAKIALSTIAFVSIVATPLIAFSGQAASVSPTSPKTTPDLSSLRDSLKKRLSGSSDDKDSSSTGSLKDKLSKKKSDSEDGQDGKDKDKGKVEEKKEGQGDKAKPPEARGKETNKNARQKNSQSGARGTGGNGGNSGGSVTVRTVGQGVYEPVKERSLEYGDVPDAGEAMTLNGPISVKEFIDTLVLATNWNALVTPDAEKVNLIFWISEMKPKEALEVLRFHDVYYEYKEDTKYLYVMTKQEYQQRTFGKQEEKEFVVQNASVDYIESALSSLLSDKGRILTDTRTQHIIVWDAHDNITKMTDTVKALDVPLSEEIFVVKHADLTDVETVLTMLVSPAGTLITDPRTSSLLVKDLKSNVDQMRAALAKLDVDIEARVFPIVNVNADTLSESVESMLTERGKLQVDPHSNVLIVTDVPGRQDQIAELIKSLDRKLETKTWVLNYIAPDDVSERIETLVPEEMGSIITDEDVHQVTVTAVPERVQEIDALIKSWDVKRRQVQIEAFLLTMTNDVERELGINWSYFGASGSTPMELKVNDGAEPDYTSTPSETFSIGQVPYANYQRNPFTGDVIKNVSGDAVIKGFGGSDIAATINYLDKHGDVTLLSTPRVTVQDGEEAIFQSGSQIPYVTSSSYGSSYGSYSPYYSSYSSSSTTSSSYNNYPYNRIDFMEVGTILNVLPRITEENSILMDIAAEDSTADVTNKVISNGQENTVPLKKQSKAETQVRVDNGHTIVIGGLRTGNSSLTSTKTVPLLSDIPVLGRLFKNPSKSVKNDSLMIFITPTIVGEETQPESDQLAKADDTIAKSLRKEDKTAFGRFAQNIKTGKNEIVVSVGQGGQIQCDGKKMSLDEFHAHIDAVREPSHSVIIIRKNPRAPEGVVNSITDIALEKQIPVEHDTRVPAFVPTAKDADAPADKSAPSAEKSAAPAPEAAPVGNAPAPTSDSAAAAPAPAPVEPKVVEAEKPSEGK